ncbi:MAG: prepilin-type N-terminal cleavage/methylation domain-containing protein [Patescibacteria group bacterium]|nr:prepilin-type N-terminal cleavage/methylation domain-containing protein [Patescibacteria group bacterium]
MFNLKFQNNSRGFTLIELLIVLGIVLLLSSSILIDFNSGGDSLSLERSAETLAQNIRKASIMTMSGQKFENEIPKGGYGIYLETAEPYQYILYANKNSNKIYDVEDEDVNIIDLEKGVKIKDIKIDGSAESDTSINFKAPDPVVSIFKNKNLATITLCLEQECDTKIRIITFYKTGAIEVE